MTFDHESCQAGQAPGRAGDELAGFPSAPDWSALRSRFFAAHEVRTVLADETGPVRLRTRGSFADGTATLLNAYGLTSRPVNLDVSSNGKPVRVKVASVAGTQAAGERG